MTTYVRVTCIDCGQDRTIVRNNKPLPQRCASCVQRGRKKSAQTPTNRITSTKARLRDTFLEAFRDADTPCKKAPDVWTSPSLADRNRAKALCRKLCPLIDACHAWAAEPPRETYGVWGGRDHGPKEEE